MTAGSHTALYVHTHYLIHSLFQSVFILTFPFCAHIRTRILACPPQAIEAFALMVKTTAQTLQAFGTELAETELPNDAEATTNLLHTHTLKKDRMTVRDAFPLSCIFFAPNLCFDVFKKVWVSL